MIAVDTLTREAWLQERRRGIGGSDAAAICGLDPWRSPLEVFLDKTGELPLDGEASEAAEWGTLLEPVVADEFARRAGVAVTKPAGMLRHPNIPWLAANLDGWVQEPGTPGRGVAEIKTTSVWQADDWDDRVPDRAMIQLLHGLAVTDAGYGYACCLIGGQRLVWRRVDRDQEAIDSLLAIEADFWRRVVDRRPPPADGSPATERLLGRLWDADPDSIVVLDPADVDGWLARRAQAKADIKAAEERCREAENRIKTLMGAAELGVVDGEVVCTWKQMPEVPVAATVRKAHRRFNVTRAGQR